MHITTRPRVAAAALTLCLTVLVGLYGSVSPAAAAPYIPLKPTLTTAPVLSSSTVVVGGTITATAASAVGATRVDHAWELCSDPVGTAPLTCRDAGVGGTRFSPTIANTGAMTLAQWNGASHHVRVRAVAYNAAGPSAPLYSPLARLAPGAARGYIEVAEWWSTGVFAVGGLAGMDGVDGAVPYRLMAYRSDGSLAAVRVGQTGAFRPDMRSVFPNVGNWGGFTLAVDVSGVGGYPVSRVCLQAGTAYVPVGRCVELPAPPGWPVMRGV